MKSTIKKGLAVLFLLLTASALMATAVSAASVSEVIKENTGIEFDLTPVDALVDAFADFSPETLLTGNLGSSAPLLAGILGFIGLLQCLFGYRLLKLEIFLAGFLVGMFLGNLLIGTGIVDSFLTDPWMEWVLMVICGLLLAFVAFLLFRVSLFIVIAFFVFTYVRGLVASYVPADLAVSNDVVAIIAGAVVGLLIALLAVKLLRTVVILLTAFTGAFTLAFALGGFVSIANFQLIVIALMFVIGVALQFSKSQKKSYY